MMTSRIKFLSVATAVCFYFTATMRAVVVDGLPVYSWCTLAGLAGYSIVRDGRGSSAGFYSPAAITADQRGNIFVVDQGAYLVRRIDQTGNVVTVAGTQFVSGSADGTGPNASFGYINGIVADSSGVVYVADTLNHTIRKITPEGMVTTLAGVAGASGSADGTASAARFSLPMQMCLSPDGNIYILDTGNAAVRKITSSGVVTTLFAYSPVGATTTGIAILKNEILIGIGGTAPHRFSPAGIYLGELSTGANQIGGIAASPDGHVLFTEVSASLVMRVSGEAEIVGGGGWGNLDGLGTSARFAGPTEITFDASGNIYVVDQYNYTIRKGTPIVPRLTWPQPAPIQEGAALSAVQLNASCNIAGTFSYSPGLGAVLPRGANTVSVTFTPSETRSYPPITATMSLLVGTPAVRLANIATRAYCSTGNAVTIGGFVVTGKGAKQVLIRAVGPSLASQGLGANEVLADPMIDVHKGASIIASNDDWNSNENAAQIISYAKEIGANPLQGTDTKSSALLLNLEPGVYSFVVSSKNSSAGIVLLEVYDADFGATTANFVNIATRAYCSTGNNVAIGGFVISGTSPKKIFIRAVGPTLAKQGLAPSEVLSDPLVELHHGSDAVILADDWTAQVDGEPISSLTSRLGATPLDSSDTKSAVSLLTLNPGVYSFVVRGKGDASGIVLLEVYDAD